MKLHKAIMSALVLSAGMALNAQNAHQMVVQTNKI